jgi:hypothetical protein
MRRSLSEEHSSSFLSAAKPATLLSPWVTSYLISGVMLGPRFSGGIRSFLSAACSVVTPFRRCVVVVPSNIKELNRSHSIFAFRHSISQLQGIPRQMQ